MTAWTSVKDRLPPAATTILAFGRKYGTGRQARKVYETFISTRPHECVEDEEITHWMPLPAPPVVEAQE